MSEAAAVLLDADPIWTARDLESTLLRMMLTELANPKRDTFCRLPVFVVDETACALARVAFRLSTGIKSTYPVISGVAVQKNAFPI